MNMIMCKMIIFTIIISGDKHRVILRSADSTYINAVLIPVRATVQLSATQ